MIDETLAVAALQSRAIALVVATTGTMTLEATAAGYKRASGSFITDGFVKGQDVTPTGFPQTTVGIITAVTATELTIDGGRTVAVPAGSRSIASGLPTQRALENEKFTPTPGRPYVTDEFVPGATHIETWPAVDGRLEENWLSIWTWYGISGVGVPAIRKGVDALKARFASGTIIALSDSTHLRVRGGDTAVRSGQIIRIDGGFSYCQVSIPLRAHTRNVVTA